MERQATVGDRRVVDAVLLEVPFPLLQLLQGLDPEAEVVEAGRQMSEAPALRASGGSASPIVNPVLRSINSRPYPKSRRGSNPITSA